MKNITFGFLSEVKVTNIIGYYFKFRLMEGKICFLTNSYHYPLKDVYKNWGQDENFLYAGALERKGKIR